MFLVIDTTTNKTIATYTNRVAAKKRADILDLNYGSCRYTVKKG